MIKLRGAREKELVQLLVKRKLVPYETALSQLYWLLSSGEERTRQNLFAIVWYLKQKLPEGSIKNHFGVGYELTEVGRQALSDLP